MHRKLPLNKNVEIMAIGARPGDVEVGVGGTLLKMAHRGYTTVICDLSRIRDLTEDKEEAERAAEVLHISERINLELGNILDARAEQADILAQCIQLYSPEILLVPYCDDWYEIHAAAGRLIRKALPLPSPYRLDEMHNTAFPTWVFYYPIDTPVIPQLIVNINSTFEGKVEALKSYMNRLTDGSNLGSQLSQAYREHLFHIESRARHFGSLVNCHFGEGLIFDHPIPIDDIYEFITP